MLRHPRVWTGFLLLSAISQTNAVWTVNMTPDATEVSQSVLDLHMTVFWICVVISMLVFGTMFWSMIIHRHSTDQQPAHFRESAAVGILWTVVPFMILVVMAVSATHTLIHVYDTSEPELDMQVTDYQWRWQYKYLGQNVGYFSNLATPRDQIHSRQTRDEHYLLKVGEPLALPVGTKVRFLITSNDAIHSWWVPAFAVKRDTIPGFVNEAWTEVDEPGIYHGQYVKLCGKDRDFIPIAIGIKPETGFGQWLTKRKEKAAGVKELTSKEQTEEELIARDGKVYHTVCAACRQAEGQDMPSTFPALKGSRIVTGPEEHHLEVVFNGVPGTAMAAFGKQLNEVDLATVITYERSAWGNDDGDMVIPRDVVAYRQK